MVAAANGENLFCGSTGNCLVNDSTAGDIYTIAGDTSLSTGYSGDGGLATSAQLQYPTGVAVDSAGNVYIADYYNNVVRTVWGDPAVTGISPSSGPSFGRTTVAITGTGFQSGATVGFGSSAATNVTVNSST